MDQLIPFSTSVRLATLILIFLFCLWLENKYPLRKTKHPKARRLTVNLGLATVGAIVLRISFYPIVLLISEWTFKENIGLLNYTKLSLVAQLFVSILLLDYTLYIWHRLNHKIPFLWRFHNAHHVDLDLDVSTSMRFHFGELILSTGYRSAQIILFGINPFTLILFETLTTAAAQFHHSNIKIPLRVERIINLFLVTPRMHGIHHSIVQTETDSNFSTIFSFWDRLHKSMKFCIPQDKIIIGVAAYRSLSETNFINTLVMPFTKQKAWKLPDGSIPVRDDD